MINQTAKKILKALSFDGVEVEAFRHMADLKRLDPMKIFYKKIDEKIYNGSHAVPIRIFFPTEKSFRESEEKKHNIQDKKMFLFKPMKIFLFSSNIKFLGLRLFLSNKHL